MFADNYLATGKVGESAEKAGASPNCRNVTGNKWLKRADIQQYLREQTTKLAEVQEPLQQRIVRELEASAFANIADFISIDGDGLPVVDFSNATEEQLRAIASVATKRKTTRTRGGDDITELESSFKMNDKLRSLDLLGQTMGLYKQSTEHKVTLDVADRLLAARQRLHRLGGPEE